MKKIVLLFFLFANFCLAQNEFSVNKDSGLTSYVVIVFDGKTSSELYKKTLDWINHTFKSPNDVVLAKTENEYIRFEGFKSELFCFHALGMKNCNDVKYQIEISFKDGKYKFQIVSLSDFIKPSQYITGGWRTTSDMPKFASNCYKNNGDVKNMCKDYVIDVPKFFNELNSDLRNYLNGNEKNDNW